MDETESPVEVKQTKSMSSHAKKTLVQPEIDKTAVLFDEKIKELFRRRYRFLVVFFFLLKLLSVYSSYRQSDSNDRQERLRARWTEFKLHFNPVYEQTI